MYSLPILSKCYLVSKTWKIFSKFQKEISRLSACLSNDFFNIGIDSSDVYEEQLMFALLDCIFNRCAFNFKQLNAKK